MAKPLLLPYAFLVAATLVLDATDQRAVTIGMGCAKQAFTEGLELAAVLLDLRTEHVGKGVAADVHVTVAMLSEIVVPACATGVTHEVGFDTEDGAEIIDKRAAAAVEVLAAGDLGIEVDVRIAAR